jgi:hypothetical protein
MTHTKDEALDKALEALEWMVANDDTNEGDEPVERLGGQSWNEYNAYWLDGLNKARASITAIKQALALDKMAENARELGLDYEPAHVQPVALRLALAEALTSVYVCGRVWDAWNCGTMSEDDFESAAECDEVLDSLVEAVAKAIPAIKQAAAQPAQQEPFEYWNAVEGWVKIDEVREHFDSVGCGTIYKTAGDGRVPLTAAQRPWVDLTHGEIRECFQKMYIAKANWTVFAHEILAKSKEKNT